MQTTVITGGAGFLGSHLSARLLHEGNRIFCIDNNYTGSVKNIEPLLDNKNFTFIEHDIINPLHIDAKIDQVYNLACPASPIHYQGKAALFTTKTCVFGIFNMLELALQHNATLLQASTSEVYGEPQITPQPEEYRGNVNSIGPRACYDEGKRCAESICFDYHREHGVDIKIIRIFNTYGPLMNPQDGRVVSNFVYQALRGDDITVYGDGSQTRSFCYVDDLIEVMIRMMASPKGFTGPVNTGNPDEFTILELAKKVIALTGSKSKIIFTDLPVDDPTQRKPNIALAMEKLAWTPKVSLEEGLRNTIEYIKNI